MLATGFRVDRFVRPTKVLGEGGLDLDEVWADSPVAYLSICVPGFPNFFMLNGPNGPVGNFSLIDVAELQMGYILELLGAIRSGTATHISAGRGGHGAVRGVTTGGRPVDHLDDGLQELVSRPPRCPRHLAVGLQPLQGGHGLARVGRLRARWAHIRRCRRPG